MNSNGTGNPSANFKESPATIGGRGSTEAEIDAPTGKLPNTVAMLLAATGALSA